MVKAFVFVLLLSGCTSTQSVWGWMTEDVSQRCIDGVLYLKSDVGGITPHVNEKGLPRPCFSEPH